MRPIDSSLIKVPMHTSTMEAAIAELLDLLAAQGLVTDQGKVYEELLARERKQTTVIGNEIAIPHCRSEFVQDTVCAYGRSVDSILFGEDQDPQRKSARVFFLMVSPRDDAPMHLKTLARIARLVKDDRRRESLKLATEVEEILELLGEMARPVGGH